jgi:hypothetical protein
MAEPGNYPEKTEDVGEPNIALSLDSGPPEKKEEEERGNVDKTEIEEQLENISLQASPEEEDNQEDFCTEFECSPPLKAVQEVDSKPPLRAVQEADSASPLKPVQEKDIDNCIYHLKWIMWHDKKTPIVTQNENGPCPLIAISNILLLRGKIIIPSVLEIITAKQLMDYIGDMILQNVPKVSTTCSSNNVGTSVESGDSVRVSKR